MNALANGKTINHELQNRQRKSVWNYRVIESVFAPMVFFRRGILATTKFGILTQTRKRSSRADTTDLHAVTPNCESFKRSPSFARQAIGLAACVG